ncbi:MAG: hypothetical protein AAGI68_16750 [Planctomycetota bacterium]
MEGCCRWVEAFPCVVETDLERVFVDSEAADFPASGTVWFRYGSRVLPDDSFEPRCMWLDAAGTRVALPRGARALLELPSETFGSCVACAAVDETEPGAPGGGDPNGVITIYPPRVPGPGQYRQASLCAGQQGTVNAPDVWVETRAVPADGGAPYSFEVDGWCYSIDSGELTDQADLPEGAVTVAPALANRIEGCGTCRNGYAMTLCPGEVPWTGPVPYVRAEVADTLLGGAVTTLYMRYRQRCWSINSADAIGKVPPDAEIVFPVDAFLSCGDCVCGDGPAGLPVGHLLTWCGSSSGGEVGTTPDLPQPVVVPLDELDGYDLNEFHTFTLRGSGGCWLHDPNRPRVRASLGGTIAQPVSRYPTCAPCLDAQDGPADTPDDPGGGGGGGGGGGNPPPGSQPGCQNPTQSGCWYYQLWDCCKREYLNKWVLYPSVHAVAGGTLDGTCVAVGFRRRKTIPAGGEGVGIAGPVDDGVGSPCTRVELVGGCQCPFYRLTDCDGIEADKLTSDDLSDHVGKVVKIGGSGDTCWQVESIADPGGGLVPVTVTSSHDDCAECFGGCGASTYVDPCCFSHDSKVAFAITVASNEPGYQDCPDTTIAGEAEWVDAGPFAGSWLYNNGSEGARIIPGGVPVGGGAFRYFVSFFWEEGSSGYSGQCYNAQGPPVIAEGDCQGGSGSYSGVGDDRGDGDFSGQVTVAVINNGCCHNATTNLCESGSAAGDGSCQ